MFSKTVDNANISSEYLLRSLEKPKKKKIVSKYAKLPPNFEEHILKRINDIRVLVNLKKKKKPNSYYQKIRDLKKLANFLAPEKFQPLKKITIQKGNCIRPLQKSLDNSLENSVIKLQKSHTVHSMYNKILELSKPIKTPLILPPIKSERTLPEIDLSGLFPNELTFVKKQKPAYRKKDPVIRSYQKMFETRGINSNVKISDVSEILDVLPYYHEARPKKDDDNFDELINKNAEKFKGIVNPKNVKRKQSYIRKLDNVKSILHKIID